MITKTDIVTEYGAYYQAGKANEKSLISLLTQGRELINFCTPIKTDDTIYRLGNAAFASLVQPFQKTFTQKGGVTFTPNEIRVFNIKIDDVFSPDEIKATWLGFLASLTEVQRKNWPLVKWLMEKYYKKIIDRDMERSEYYKGVFAAPETGTPGPDGTSMNGLQIQLQTGVDAGTINSVDLTGGALAVGTIFDQVEEFTDKISEDYQGVEMNIFLSRSWYKKYMQDKRAQGFYQKFSDKDIDSGIDFTPQSLKPLASMAGTDNIWCTPKENLLHVSPATLMKNKFNVEEAKRQVAVMGDWWEGLGFGLNQVVWTNIQPTI